MFEDAIRTSSLADGNPALQLDRLSEMGEVIRRAIGKRIKGKRLTVDADWRGLLDKHLDVHGASSFDELEEKAREEKTAGLKELAESRLSILIGLARDRQDDFVIGVVFPKADRSGRYFASCTHREGTGSDGAGGQRFEAQGIYRGPIPQPASV